MLHLTTLVLTALVATVPAPSTQERPARPNVLFLLADDQRPDAIGAFGNEHVRTPHLDTLAERGFRFARTYCMGSIHGAVCQPSRAMLLTGRSLWRVPMDLRGVPTLPEHLARAGYATFITGKWHNGADALKRTFQSGHAVMLGGMSNHSEVPVKDLVDGELVRERTGAKFSSELFADAVIDFLEGHESEQPFFAWVSFTAPHDPRQPPEEYRREYYERRPPLPPNFLPQHPFHNGWMVGRDEKLAPWPRPSAMIADQLAEYYGMITHLDAQVGRILAVLEAQGLADDTIVVYTADHGLAMGSHGLLGKQSVYEHSMGAPLIIAGPGIPSGRSDALAYLYDLAPTLCASVGLRPPPGVEGRSLAPIWRGEAGDVRTSLFLTYEDLMRAVVTERWKLIRYPRIDHVQLFDLAADPHELQDLAERPEQQERVAAMTALLREHRLAAGDPHPFTVDEPESMAIDLSGRGREPDRWQPDWIVEKYFREASSPAAEGEGGGR